MKHLKILVVAVAALAMLAFIGAGSASATELYETTKTLGVNTEIAATQAGSGILETTSGTVLDTCTGSTFKGKVTNAGGSGKPVTGDITQLSWTGCTNHTTTIVLGNMEIKWTGAGTVNGTVIAKESKVTVAGIFGVSCTYIAGTGTTLGTLVGNTAGGNATISINAIVNGDPLNSGLCPTDTRWTSSYVVTVPGELHVTDA